MEPLGNFKIRYSRFMSRYFGLISVRYGLEIGFFLTLHGVSAASIAGRPQLTGDKRRIEGRDVYESLWRMWKATSKNSPEYTVISPLDISVMTQNSYPLKTAVPPAHWMSPCFYLRGHLIFPCSLGENGRENSTSGFCIILWTSWLHVAHLIPTIWLPGGRLVSQGHWTKSAPEER